MNQFDPAILISLIGLALLAGGLGIRFAYGQILPYAASGESQRHRPPQAIIDLFMKFVRAAHICIATGVVLLLGGLLAPWPAHNSVSGAIHVPVSLCYAALLGILLLILSYNVLRHRVGDAIGDDVTASASARIARVHANFTEYVPTGLALLITLEWAGAPTPMLHLGGALFTLGRYLHAWGFTHHEFISFGRIVGIQTTLFALCYMVLAAAWCMFLS